ncbi:hypothetical protein G6F42_013721 [Rhizopus arrhizus]|nr:hypothetical protein G6F42_013721 [Rhizopus arrhizus]
MMQIVIPCLALKPADGTCSPLAKERLALLVSDIRDTIALSENAGLTVPLLLTQFGLFLPICIEEKFHDIIYTISKSMSRCLRCVFFVLSVVGASYYSKLTLSFLLNDMPFINLFFFDTPMDVLEKTRCIRSLMLLHNAKH